MGWGKFDDRYALNRKVRPLSDAAFRLDVSAILWCNAQLTDGRIEPDELAQVSDVKAPTKAAAELVRRGRWHPAGKGCGTDECPPGEPGDGWQIHDYLEFNESKKIIEARRTADRNRKKKPRGSSPPPKNPDGFQPESERNPGGVRPASEVDSAGIPSDPSRTPAGARAQARAPSRPVPSLPDVEDPDPPGASVDAQEPHEPDRSSERTAAQRLTARYAAGVRLADGGQAIRTLTSALVDDRLPERLLEGAVDVLIAEQGACTRGRLRVALLKAEGNWGPAGSAGGQRKPGNPYLDDMRARGTGTDSFRALFAVPDTTTPALEAR